MKANWMRVVRAKAPSPLVMRGGQRGGVQEWSSLHEIFFHFLRLCRGPAAAGKFGAQENFRKQLAKEFRAREFRAKE